MSKAILLTEEKAKSLEWLQRELRTQDRHATETPLFCIHAPGENRERDGKGELVAIFLTLKQAESFLGSIKHHYGGEAYLWVRGQINLDRRAGDLKWAVSFLEKAKVIDVPPGFDEALELAAAAIADGKGVAV